MRLQRILLLPILFLVACGGFRETGVGRLAAHDLNCPIDQVEITRDAPFEKSFQGCGRSVTYVRRSGGGSAMGIARGADAWAMRPPSTD